MGEVLSRQGLGMRNHQYCEALRQEPANLADIAAPIKIVGTLQLDRFRDDTCWD